MLRCTILLQNTGEGALRASPSAKPPLNMRKALVFNGAFTLFTGMFVFLLRGKQARKELDEEKNQAQMIQREDVGANVEMG
jgi:FLVCR family MFS transporter 7